MPKRVKKTNEAGNIAVSQKSPEEQANVHQNITPTNMVVFTENELKNKQLSELKSILNVYKVNFDDGKKNTRTKLVGLILESQTKSLNDSGSTPSGLVNFKVVTPELSAVEKIQQSTVTYSISVTKMLKEYESVKIFASVSIPVDYSDADLIKSTEALGVAKTLVLSKLNEDLLSIKRELNM
jgi:hypothetical protein